MSTYNIDITIPAFPFTMSLPLVKHPISVVAFYIPSENVTNMQYFTTTLCVRNNSTFFLHNFPKKLADLNKTFIQQI